MKQIVYFAVFAAMSAVFLANIVIISVNPVFAATAGEVASAKTSGDERIEKRIKKLHADLKITPAQETLWNNVAQVMRENHEQMDKLTKAREKGAKTMTAVEDLKSYSEIIDANAVGLKKFIPPFEALYASMSDEQKKNADTFFRGRTHKKMKGK